jgi:RND family efflux transporter MFP subunit
MRSGVAAMWLVLGAVLPAAARADEVQVWPCLIEPSREIKLATPSAGVIAKVLVDRGDQVTAGQLVAELTSALEAADLATARLKAADDSRLKARLARRKLTQERWDRLKRLTGEAKFVSQANLDQAEADALDARAEVEQVRNELKLAAIAVEQAEAKLAQRRLVSPVDGVVTKRDLSPGEYGYEQQPAMTIAELDPLNVELFLPVSAYGVLRLGERMEVRPQAPIGGSYAGTVAVIDRDFDSRSGTFGVRVRLPNPGYRLPAGIRCTVTPVGG